MNLTDFSYYYNSLACIDFITKMNLLKRGHKGTSSNGAEKPLSTLISFNASKDGVLTFKLYCELFRDSFTDEEIERFVPSKEFKKYLPFWDSSKPSSLCFGIKLSTSLEETKYSYLKLRYNDVKNEFSNNKLELEYNSDFVGIAFEYFNNELKETKKYWYYSNPNDIRKILGKFNLTDTILNHPILHIEYTEFSNRTSKIIVVYDYFNSKNFDDEFLPDLINSSFPQPIKDIVTFMKIQFDLDVRYFGVYDKNITSLYWSLTGKTLHNFLKIDSYNV